MTPRSRSASTRTRSSSLIAAATALPSRICAVTARVFHGGAAPEPTGRPPRLPCMAIRAQLSQERSRLRRDELLAAAIELFAEGGSRAITHRAVAARAGLPSATTTYYFESIDELIREALGAHIEKWIARPRGAGQDRHRRRRREPRRRPCVHLARVFAVRRPEVAALELAIFLAAARVPELRDDTARAMQALEDLVDQAPDAGRGPRAGRARRLDRRPHARHGAASPVGPLRRRRRSTPPRRRRSAASSPLTRSAPKGRPRDRRPPATSQQ